MKITDLSAEQLEALEYLLCKAFKECDGRVYHMLSILDVFIDRHEVHELAQRLHNQVRPNG